MATTTKKRNGRTTPRKRANMKPADVAALIEYQKELETFLDVLYARISFAGGRNVDETSIPTQLDECGAWSALNNGTVVASEYDLGKSAYDEDAKREGLERALRMIEAGKANRLVVWKLDRVYRNAKAFNAMLERIEKAGGTFASKSEPWLDTASPWGYLLVNLIATVAEIESRNKAERIEPWHAKRKATGAVPGGPRPYGYVRGTFDKKTGEVIPAKNVLTIDPAEAKAIRAAAKAVLRGDSMRSVAMGLNAQGFRSTQANGEWSHLAVKYFLTNPTTAGKRANDDGTFTNGCWDAILDEETWTALRALLFDPKRARPDTPRTLQHYLSGAIRCGRCNDGAMAYTRPNANGIRYTCRTCHNSIKKETAEDLVKAYIFANIDEDVWSDMRARGRKLDPRALERQKAVLRTYEQDYENGEMDEDDYRAACARVRARIASLAEVEALELPEIDSVRDDWDSLSATDRRLVVNAVFETITLQPRSPGCDGTERIELLRAA